MISTNNKSIWKKSWSIKDHGKNYKKVFFKKHLQGFRWLHDYTGSNYRMTEIQAAIGRNQLKFLNKQIKKRNQITKMYLKGLNFFWDKVDLLKKPDFKCSSCPVSEDTKNCKMCKNSFYRLNFFINPNKLKQLKIIGELNKKNIACGVGSCPEIYKENIFKKLKIYPKKRLKNAEILGKTSLMFPINPYKTFSKIRSDINLIRNTLNRYI